MMKLLIKIPIIKKYYVDWQVLSKSTLGYMLINFIFQRIFRINGKFKYPISFTSKVVNAKNLRIFGSGKRTIKCLALNGGCYFQAANGIEIHEGVLIAAGTKIISGNHDLKNYDLEATPAKPIIINKDVWLGANVVVLPEVEIADGCIIGAGSVVTKSILEANSIVVGNPARIIKNKNEL